MKQISIFIENKDGELAEVAALFAKNNINLRALSLADTQDFGILRVIVEDPDKAVNILKEAGYAYSMTDVVAVAFHDKAGALSEVLNACLAADISVEYAYAFLSKKPDTACMIFRTSDHDKTVELLEGIGMKAVSQDEIFNI